MRVYLPLSPADFDAPTLEVGVCFVPDASVARAFDCEDLEDTEAVALDLAALHAWAAGAPRRIAAAADIDGAGLGPALPATTIAALAIPSCGAYQIGPVGWEAVVSIHCDTPEVSALATRARTDSAAGEELVATPLSWFDVTERGLVRSLFASAETA